MRPAASLERLFSTWKDFLSLHADGRAAISQAGAIPYTVVRNQVVFLLITSRRTGRWIFPKGALIAGWSPAAVAAHEAFEEAGVEGEIEARPIGDYRSVKFAGIGRTPIRVDMFPLRVTRQHDDWPEKANRHRHWVILPEARRLLSEPKLIELAAAIVRREAAAAQNTTLIR